MCNPGKLRAADTGDCTDSATTITLACEDALVQLPAESASLTVAVTPPHKGKSAYYSYTWEMKTSPEKVSSPATVCIVVLTSDFRISVI